MEQQCSKKLLDQARHFIGLKHYSYRTEQAYVSRIKRCIYFHDARHPSEMGAPEAAALVIHLLLKWQEDGRIVSGHWFSPDRGCGRKRPGLKEDCPFRPDSLRCI